DIFVEIIVKKLCSLTSAPRSEWIKDCIPIMLLSKVLTGYHSIMLANLRKDEVADRLLHRGKHLDEKFYDDETTLAVKANWSHWQCEEFPDHSVDERCVRNNKLQRIWWNKKLEDWDIVGGRTPPSTPVTKKSEVVRVFIFCNLNSFVLKCVLF